MSRFQELKRLDKKTRNKVRAIISSDSANAIGSLTKLRGTLGKAQSDALDAVINGLRHEKAVHASNPFPKKPPFIDTVQPHNDADLDTLLSLIEVRTTVHKARLLRVANALEQIDDAYAAGDFKLSRQRIVDVIERDGWSHALLRRIVLIRENLPEGKEDEELEQLIRRANLKAVIATSLVHTYALDQSFLTIKRSILNMPNKGPINRYSRTICKLAVQPFCRSKEDLCAFLSEVAKCSLIDAIILAKFNRHLFAINDYVAISEVANSFGRAPLFEKLVATYDASDRDSEYTFFKQNSAWLEYEPVRQYRILLDHYYDASRDEMGDIHETLLCTLKDWVGDATLASLVSEMPFTKHPYQALAKLEMSGVATKLKETLLAGLEVTRSEYPKGQEKITCNIQYEAATSSGSAVIAQNGRTSTLAVGQRKLVGFDMEVYSMYEAARHAARRSAYFAAKAVVDDGGNNKGDHFHRIGCLLSAKFVTHAIREGIADIDLDRR